MTAHLTTHSIAFDNLPFSLRDNYYPLNCFKLICELLHGIGDCIATRDRSLGRDEDWLNAKEADALVTRVRLSPVFVFITLVLRAVLGYKSLVVIVTSLKNIYY